jgi:hypothetical protein
MPTGTTIPAMKYVDKPHHPETVVPVTVVRIPVVAIVGPRVVIVVVPRAAAQHPAGLLPGGLMTSIA